MSQPHEDHPADEAPVERPSALGDARQSGQLDRCPRCAMQVRRTELDIHLAHSHNIGPVTKSEKGKDGRGRRRSSERS